MVLDLVGARSVVDVGCGVGSWLSVFRELGVEDILGLDGAYVPRPALQIPVDKFQPVDLGRPFSLDRTFDLAVSLEVAEHLEAESAQGFVASLTVLAPVVLFSAAIPFQTGEGHINEQWPAYWAALFREQGYVPVDCLRRKVWSHQDVEWWYAQNMVMYVRGDELSRFPVLERAYDPQEEAPPALVHPGKLLELMDWIRRQYVDK